MCRCFKIKAIDKWYKHHIEAVTEGETVTSLWEFSLCIDRIIKANKPDIVFEDENNKICLFADMNILFGHNILAKEFDNIREY